MGKRGISLIIILAISSFYFVNSGVDNQSLQNDISSIAFPESDDILSNFQDTEKDNSISQNVITKEVSQAIETNSITSEVHSPGRDSYIVDFGFQQLYSYEASQTVYDGFAGYIGFNESAFFSVELSLPVNITLHYSNTATAGKKTAVLVDLFKVSGGASFSVSYGFTLGGSYKMGWGNLNTFELFNYSNTYEIPSFEVPLDPVPLTELAIPLPLQYLPYGVGLIIDQIFGIDLILAPQLDVDISADLFFEGLGDLSISTLNFNSEEQQSFTINVDSFSQSTDSVRFGLTNFSMDFYLSLLWSMQLKLKGFFSFIGPWRINLFTYPRISLGGRPTTGETYGLLDILPTEDLPSFSLDTYDINDGGNGILEPGDTGSIFVDFNNIGDGPAVNANITVASQNITVDSGITGEYVFNSNQDRSFSHEISFTLAGGYTRRNITVYFDIIWLSANGSIRSQQEELLIRVLQPGDAYLSLDQWSIFEPNDGIWDAGETVKIDIDVSKIGSGSVIYAELEILGTVGPDTYSSNATLDFIASTFSTWNATDMFLTAPSDITEKYVDVIISIGYELSTGEIYFDYQIITFDISPLSAKIDLVQVYGTLLSGEDDGIFMAGETFSMTVALENIGNDISGPIVGGFYSEDPDIIFPIDDLMDWNSISPGFNDLSINSISMEINPGAVNKTVTIYLIVGHITWYGEFILEVFPINLNVVQQPDPEPSLNYYEVYDSNLLVSNLAPGEVFLVTVGVDVINGPAYDTIGYLSSDNENIFIYNDTSFYDDLYPGGLISEGDGFIVYVPANFEGGTVRFYVNVTMYNGIGDLIFSLAYFDILIATGDIAIPTYTLDTTTTATAGESVTITISTSDNIGVEDIYFAYYDYDTGDWILELLEWTSTPLVSYTLVMSNETLLYAFIIFDVSGNYVGAGLDTPLEINLPDVSSSTSSSDTTSSTTETTTSIIPSQSTSSTIDETPLSIISLILGLIVIPTVIRRKPQHLK